VILRRVFTIIFAAVLSAPGWAQIVTVGLPHSEDQAPKKPSNGRTKALSLPFFDDFAATRTTFADPTLWTYGRSIRVNDGMAIRPPSIKVATFDGVDSVGKPYNTDQVLAKGYADKLESQAVDLSTVDAADRTSVFLSYMYQLKGNGEIPDAGDRILVTFLDKDKMWVPVDTVETNELMQTNVFYTSMIQVKDERYYHPDFKFRIQNFSRLSGPYDTWNIDYIYLNKGRSLADTSFPDRTISEPLTSLFGKYRSVPIKHFQKNPAGILVKPSVLATNLRANNPQPIDFSSRAIIGYKQNGTVSKTTVTLDAADTINQALFKGVYTKITSKHLPDLATLSFNADSIGVEIIFGINTRDNKIVDPDGDGRGDTDLDEGDYDPLIYSPIDFRYSDTTRAIFKIFNQYAYDDGIAEYAAGLNQPGAQIAYEYNLLEVTTETITHLDMYFPRFGDELPQIFELRIWNDLAQEPVYREVTTVQKAQENTFWLKQLTEPVPVGKKFYIGWKQSAAAVIAAGLDKNTSSGEKLFSNTNGTWTQNTSVAGSLMFRPVFGEGLGQDPNGLEDEKNITVYPNPADGTFYFAGGAEQILVYDMTGRSVGFTTETSLTETKVTLPDAARGIYIMRVHQDGAVRTAKILIR
jgi:Secretion system C-terminal sorting domain